MKILITGHKGLVGQELYNELIKEHSVIGIDRIEGNDILNIELNFDVDIVIHLAGETGLRKSIENPKLFWENNVIATKKIFRSFPNTRILYASSSTAKEPFKNPYAMTKKVIEEIAPENSLGMRFTTIYNDKQTRPDMFIPRLLRKEVPYVTNHKRDFIHVSDIVEAIKLLILTETRGIIDIGTGESVKLTELTDLVNIQPEHINKDNERLDNVADVSILKNLGWKPKVNIFDFVNDKKELDFSQKPKYNVI